MTEIAVGEAGEHKFAATERVIAWAARDPVDNSYFKVHSASTDGKNSFEYGSQRGSLRVALAFGDVWVSRWAAGAATDRNEIVRYRISDPSATVIPENLSDLEVGRQAHLAGSDREAVWCRSLADETSGPRFRRRVQAHG